MQDLRVEAESTEEVKTSGGSKPSGRVRKKKARIKTWSDVVKGLKKDEELEIANSDKSWNESEVESDLEDPNQLKAKRTRRKWNQRVEKRRSCNNKGAEMGLLSRQADQGG